MRVHFSFNTAAVAVAIVVIIVSTATLSFLGYTYTLGRTSVADEIQNRTNTVLTKQTVDVIENKIIVNDNILNEIIDVNDPAKWDAQAAAIKKNTDLNVEQVYILKVTPDLKRGNNLPAYPQYTYAIRNSWGAFRTHFNTKDLNWDNLAHNLNVVHHLHKEKQTNYFFASYVLKEDLKGNQFLLCFQMSWDAILNLLQKNLSDLQLSYFISIVDYDGNPVYQPPISRSVKYFSEAHFPSTFYKWMLYAVPRNYSELEREVRNQRRTILFIIILSVSLIFFSLAIIYAAGWRERQLRQLKEDFISNVSHELKTPLSLIRMFSEILVTGRIKSEEAKREYYKVIYNESDRMGRLVHNLLDFASLERDKTRKYFEKTEIAKLIEKALDAYRYELQKEGFQLVAEIDGSIPETMADPNAISMAFFNLLDNSMKYSGEQKEIGVRVSRDGDTIAISVSDKGVGIPPSEQQKIFEKFYRGSGTHVKNTRGSGIGLAITKQVAEMHGGEVNVDSEPGKGSTFRLVIPIRKPEEMISTSQESA
jgi:two-component system, OmpR family, phosphate regulon sensor histidine kinase PhoR